MFSETEEFVPSRALFTLFSAMEFSAGTAGAQVVVVILPTEENKDSGAVMNDVFVPAVDQERHEIIFVLPQEWAQMLAAADKEGRARIFPLNAKTNP